MQSEQNNQLGQGHAFRVLPIPPNNNEQNAYNAYNSAQAMVMPSIDIDPSRLSATYNEWTTTEDFLQIVRSDILPLDPRNFTISWPPLRSMPSLAIDPKPRKIAKIKKATPTQVATAIAKHTKTKAKEVANQANVMEATIISEEQKLAERHRELDHSKHRINFYKAQQARLGKTKKQIVVDFEEAIAGLMQEENIEAITIDDQGRLLVTTTVLSIIEPHWKEPKDAGKYQIRIDFSRVDARHGVRVLNITQRSRDYDSPTISNTYCCWGNIQLDIERDFHTQNIYELVTDMIAYIASPKVHGGYLLDDGREVTGWDTFFSTLESFPENYNWEVFEKEHPNVDTMQDERHEPLTLEPRLAGPEGAIPTAPPMIGIQEQMEAELIATRGENRNLREQLDDIRPNFRSTAEADLFHTLRRAGFSENASYHFFENIQQTSGHILVPPVLEIQIRRIDEAGYEMRIIGTGGQVRMFVNSGDFADEQARENIHILGAPWFRLRVMRSPSSPVPEAVDFYETATVTSGGTGGGTSLGLLGGRFYGIGGAGAAATETETSVASIQRMLENTLLERAQQDQQVAADERETPSRPESAVSGDSDSVEVSHTFS